MNIDELLTAASEDRIKTIHEIEKGIEFLFVDYCEGSEEFLISIQNDVEFDGDIMSIELTREEIVGLYNSLKEILE